MDLAEISSTGQPTKASQGLQRGVDLPQSVQTASQGP